jgi:protein phosphatase
VSQANLKIAGDTHVGKVRTTNEDSMIVDHQRGLYVVLDGMGGANAGDIASQTARDAIRDFVAQRRQQMEPKALIDAAIQYGSAAVWNAAQQVRERHGRGRRASRACSSIPSAPSSRTSATAAHICCAMAACSH